MSAGTTKTVFKKEDLQHMSRALDLAESTPARVSPNPVVGAVVVQGGAVVGEGRHERFGEAHAEVNALKQAGEKARGATMYVSLEPCNHAGKTPPCTRAIREAGIKRVVMAVRDPDPVAGGGAEALLEAGIEVVEGVMAHRAREVNRAFFKHRRTGLPFVTAKWAMTADGKIATRTGDSRWVSSEESRAMVHRVREHTDAVLVGCGTVLADDPELTSRGGPGKNPARVVADTSLKTPPNARLLPGDASGPHARVILACAEDAGKRRAGKLERAGAEILRLPKEKAGVDAEALLRALAERGMLSVLCEGGSRLLGSLFDRSLVDEVVVLVAPKIVGGMKALSPVGGVGTEFMKDAAELTEVNVEQVGDDVLLRGRVGDWPWLE